MAKPRSNTAIPTLLLESRQTESEPPIMLIIRHMVPSHSPGMTSETTAVKSVSSTTDSGSAHTFDGPNRMISMMRGEIFQIDPQQPISDASSIERLLSTSIAQPRLNMALLVGLAFCALVLAAVGIYAVVSCAVARHTIEMGVRMAIGAGRCQILRMVVGESLRVVAIRSVLGLVGALGLVRLIQSLLFELTATNPATYSAAMFVVLSVGVMASIVPVLRATRGDPVVALPKD